MVLVLGLSLGLGISLGLGFGFGLGLGLGLGLGHGLSLGLVWFSQNVCVSNIVSQLISSHLLPFFFFFCLLCRLSVVVFYICGVWW